MPRNRNPFHPPEPTPPTAPGVVDAAHHVEGGDRHETLGHYRRLLDCTAQAIYGLDLEGNCTFCNPPCLRLLGYGVAQSLIGRNMHALIHHSRPDGTAYPETECRIYQAFRKGEDVHVADEVFWRADGTCFPAEYWSHPLLRDGVVVGAVVTFLDVTERRRTEERLRRSEAEMRAVLDAAMDAIIGMDERGIITSWNVRAEAIFGWSREEAVGRSLSELIIPPRYRESHHRGLAHFISTGEGPVLGRRVELPALRRDGREFPAELSIAALKQGDSFLFSGFVADISERKRAEEALKVSEERYRALFDSNPHPMWVYDCETLRFLAVNAAAVESYGYSRNEFLDMTIEDIRPPEDIPALRANLAAQTPPGMERGDLWRHRKKDGTLIDVEISSHGVSFDGQRARLVLANDVTERKRLEDQLRQSQKMEAIGQLAGGVAHDFNNLLAVITGYGDLLQKHIGPEHAGHRGLEQIRRAADRASTLTRQLLTFSRKQVFQPRPLDLSVVVGEIEKMLRRVIPEDVQLITLLDPRLGRVSADPGQIEQVIVNLAVNGRDAMPQGGKLTIETANVDLAASYARKHPGARPGPHVTLAVSDTGTGMDASTITRIFEPFFTTKEPGKGTGLGLSTVYGIVKQSGGHIEVHSEPGRGSTFKVFLPRTEAAARTPRSATEGEVPRGSETILLVEDEGDLRVLTREILEEGGYRVLEAGGPDAALQSAPSHPGPIHLVLTDVVMPRMSGREMAARLKTLRPEIQVLYMSGYTDDAIGHHGVLSPGTHFLQKPFTPETLLRKVREVLVATGPQQI